MYNRETLKSNHVLDAGWDFAGAQPQPGQHHVVKIQRNPIWIL